MAQIFNKGTLLALKLGTLIIIAMVICLIILWRWNIDYPNATREPVNQPIPFSHKHHVQDDGIDCRYCHATVERAASAGMPASEVCLNCHSQLFKDQPMLAQLQTSVRLNKPVQWIRVHDLPDFVYFDHSVHVSHGVACQSCHGRVDEMALTARVHSLDMQWCLDCHRHPQPNLVARDQVFSMRTEVQKSGPEKFSAATIYHLPGKARLTDCSSCHR